MDLLAPLARLANNRPNLWRDVERAVAEHHAQDTQDTFLPRDTWMEFSEGTVDFDWTWPTVASVLCPWRYSQRVYRFDADLFKQLTDKPGVSALPVETLLRMPDWSIYIDWAHVHGIAHNLRLYCGAWVQVGIEPDGSVELRAAFHAPDSSVIIQVLPLMRGLSFAETIRANADTYTMSTAADAEPTDIEIERVIELTTELIGRVIPLALFLCSDEPEVERLRVETSERLSYRKSKSGLALRTPKRPRVYDVGEEFGRKIRSFDRETRAAKGGGKTPHIRRAHWHTYMTGPRNAEQMRVMRWIPPLMIGVKET